MVIIPGLVKRERKIPAIFLAQILTISMDGPLKKCRKLLNYGRDFVLGCACVVWLWAILAKHEISLGNINLINLINLIVENFNITNSWTVGYFCRFLCGISVSVTLDPTCGRFFTKFNEHRWDKIGDFL